MADGGRCWPKLAGEECGVAGNKSGLTSKEPGDGVPGPCLGRRLGLLFKLCDLAGARPPLLAGPVGGRPPPPAEEVPEGSKDPTSSKAFSSLYGLLRYRFGGGLALGPPVAPFGGVLVMAVLMVGTGPPGRITRGLGDVSLLPPLLDCWPWPCPPPPWTCCCCCWWLPPLPLSCCGCPCMAFVGEVPPLSPEEGKGWVRWCCPCMPCCCCCWWR